MLARNLAETHDHLPHLVVIWPDTRRRGADIPAERVDDVDVVDEAVVVDETNNGSPLPYGTPTPEPDGAEFTVTVALAGEETLLLVSSAQAYKVFCPVVENVYEVGADADHPGSDDEGVDAVSVSRYPVTP